MIRKKNKNRLYDETDEMVRRMIREYCKLAQKENKISQD